MESTFSPFVTIKVTRTPRLVSTWHIRKISNGVILSWEPGFGAGAENIIIYRKKDGEESYRRVGTVNSAISSFTDKTPVAGSLYVYIIRAEDGKETLARSEEKNIRY